MRFKLIKDLIEHDVVGDYIFSNSGLLYYSKGHSLTRGDIMRLKISLDDFDKYYTISILSSGEILTLITHDNSLIEINNVVFNSTSTKQEISALGVSLMREVFKEKRVINELYRLYIKDETTFKHSKSVALISLKLGIELGLSSKDLSSLVIGSLLHDIGKVSISSTILNKPDKLSTEEFCLLTPHTTYGCDIAERCCTRNQRVLNIINEHHEKLDGTGYPLKKSGSEIDYLSKIVAVTDIADAITSNRPYREPGKVSFINKVLSEDATKGKLDANIVRVFLETFGFA